MARVKEENPEMTDEAARGQCTAQPAPEAEKALGDKLIAVMKEYTDHAIEEAKANTAKRIEAVKNETENELIDSIRKGLGLNKDPVVHLSEVEGLVRKIVLGEKPHGKRTETDIGEKPTEGPEETQKIKSAKTIFKELRKNRSVI